MSNDNKIRKNISKKTRFEVLKRDSFSCQYCGASAPEAILHIDHIKPVSKGGNDDILNLVTACSDCNLGKSNVELDDNSAVNIRKKQLDEINSRREQVEMMIEWKNELSELDLLVFESILDHINNQLSGRIVSDSGLSLVKKWSKKYNYDVLYDAVEDSSDQYLVLGDDGNHTKESASKFISMIPRIAFYKEKHGNDGAIKKIMYARGVLKNRIRMSKSSYHKSLGLLKDAYSVSGDADQLVDISKEVTSFREFELEMVRVINGDNRPEYE